MVSIAVLLIALVIILVVMLNTHERRFARENRTVAVKTLLSRYLDDTGDDSLNLNQIAASLTEPLAVGGSLDNLYHFLAKDPGRREFAGPADRRRSGEYLDGETGILADHYSADLENSGLPDWAPDYVGKVKALFESVRNDILILTGIPESLTNLPRPDSIEISITMRTEKAVGQFASMWIPRGETASSYEMDRRMIRGYLMGNKRFLKRLNGLDNGWNELAASLYNLSVDTRWLTAVQYVPELESDLDELIILVLTADIHRRSEDIMAQVPGSSVSPGILWFPEFSYYKNIPELSGQTADESPTIFFAKVNLGYTFRDGRTQTWLNRRKDWMTDYFITFFSGLKSEDFSPIEESDRNIIEWKSARLKAEGIHQINNKIVIVMPFGSKGVYGVRDLAFVRVNLLANP